MKDHDDGDVSNGSAVRDTAVRDTAVRGPFVTLKRHSHPIDLQHSSNAHLNILVQYDLFR